MNDRWKSTTVVQQSRGTVTIFGASAAIEQHQFIAQENVNEPHTSVAVAEDSCSAGSPQVTMQENENVQLTFVASTNVWASA